MKKLIVISILISALTCACVKTSATSDVASKPIQQVQEDVSKIHSIDKALHIAAGACCAQILYMKQTLLDYGLELGSVLLCDNQSAIKIGKNPVQHSRTKHIDVRHHFLRDHEAKGDILLTDVRSENNLADIFTKPLEKDIFVFLRNELNVLDASNVM